MNTNYFPHSSVPLFWPISHVDEFAATATVPGDSPAMHALP